jgi:hypothetical protein
MFITKNALSRRTVLRGMSATMALPFLEAMVPALTAQTKTAATPARRFGAVFVPMGLRPGHWAPVTEGRDFEMPTILKPLEPYRQSVVVVSNIDRPKEGTHVASTGTWLTGSVIKKTEAEDIYAGTSLDQMIAKQIGRDTMYPSLELTIEDFTGYIGACDIGYACAYMNTLSWATPTTPLPMELNPRVVFEKMFGRPGTPEQRARRRQEDASILDSVKEDANRLQRGLGASDRARLRDYLEYVREIEERIQRAEQHSPSSATVPEAPVGVPERYEDHVALMFDLLAVAYQADITRVFTFMMAREASQLVFPAIGVNEPWHHISHHGGKPAYIADLIKLNTWQMQMFARFLERLRSTPDGDGSVLDHSVILYGSGMSESNSHSPHNVPLIVAGGGAGLIRGNRHIKAPSDDAQVANVMLDVANKFGVEIETFGVSNGRIEL